MLRRRMEAERRSGTLGCGMRVGAGGGAKSVIVVGVMLLLSVPLSSVSAVSVVLVVHCSCDFGTSSPCTDDVSSGSNDVITGVAVAACVAVFL